MGWLAAIYKEQIGLGKGGGQEEKNFWEHCSPGSKSLELHWLGGRCMKINLVSAVS